MKKWICILTTLLLMLQLLAPVSALQDTAQTITLSSEQVNGSWAHSATLDGNAVTEYDYTWHIDPTTDYGQVKNSPGEYYTGTAPTGQDAVYIAHDIIYYPMLDQSKFQKVNYDGEQEWVYFYEAEGYEDFIFSTLPVQRTGFPSHMMHTAQEAYQNAVLHITQPGTYRLSGTWHGQIRVDLGDEDEVFADPDQKVTLILDGVDITCDVAAGVVFASVYECDNAWEDADSYSHIVDTRDAGANVVIADGTVNNVSGTNIFRLLRTKYKDEDSTDAYPAQKKQYKVDAAFYSYQSMNITGGDAGTGVLNIVSENEGLGTELHLTINGGKLNIFSQDDGINVNEDDVSVLTVNGGNLHICAGLGAEGDGVDSNGYLLINGGTVISAANPAADSGLDSDCGSFVCGGTVVALGATMDWAEADTTGSSTQPVLNMRFAASQNADEAIVLTDTDGNVVFAYDPDKDEVTGSYSRTYSGAIISAPSLSIGSSYHIYIGGDITGSESSGVYNCAEAVSFAGSVQQCYSGSFVGNMGGMFRPDKMEGMTPPEGMQRPEGTEGMTPPEGMQRPEGAEGMTPPEEMQRPEDAEGMTRPDGGRFEQNWGVQGASCTFETAFTMQSQVNAFSSVTDYRHAPTAQADGSYLCTGCGSSFADEACTTLLSQAAPSDNATQELLVIAMFTLSGCCLLAAAVGIVVLLRRGKKTEA